MDVIINNMNISEDFGINITDVRVSPAVPLTVITKIPGRNGIIDQSKALSGYVHYDNRTLTITGYVKETYAEYLKRYSALVNAIDGDIVKIINREEENFQWEGRPATTYEHVDSIHSEVTIECDVFPYKRKTEDTIVTKTINGKEEIICTNMAEVTVPTITLTAPMKVIFGEKTFSLNAGTHIVDIAFKAGNNKLIAEGDGEILIRYREGCL